MAFARLPLLAFPRGSQADTGTRGHAGVAIGLSVAAAHRGVLLSAKFRTPGAGAHGIIRAADSLGKRAVLVPLRNQPSGRMNPRYPCRRCHSASMVLGHSHGDPEDPGPKLLAAFELRPTAMHHEKHVLHCVLEDGIRHPQPAQPTPHELKVLRIRATKRVGDLERGRPARSWVWHPEHSHGRSPPSDGGQIRARAPVAAPRLPAQLVVELVRAASNSTHASRVVGASSSLAGQARC